MADHPVAQSDASEADALLVRRFYETGDEAAFALIVRRYEAMVLGVCRRVLVDHGDVEDAFQATFLVLARNARKIRKQASISSWLYGVAYRISVRAAQKRYRRREASLEQPIVQEDSPLDQIARRHEQRVVDEELQLIPSNLRQAVVLHFLNGWTSPQIAKHLGISVSAVEGRLKRGKKLLGKRLMRRGVAPCVATWIAATVYATEAHASEPLIARVIEQAATMHQGWHGQGVSTELAREEVLRMSMIGTKSLVASGIAIAVMISGAAGFLPRLVGQETGRTDDVALLAQIDSPAETEAAIAGPSGASGGAGGVPGGTFQEPGATDSGESTTEVTNAKSGAGYSRYQERIDEIEEVLNQTTEFNFFEEPLKDAAELLSERHGVTIKIDQLALEEMGLDRSVPFSLALSNVSLRSALKQILDPLELTYEIRNEVLLITSVEEAEAHPGIRVYNLAEDNRVDADELVQLITTMIAPNEWRDVGGEASIASLNNRLIVSSKQEIHEQIAIFLSQLKDSGALDGRGGIGGLGRGRAVGGAMGISGGGGSAGPAGGLPGGGGIGDASVGGSGGPAGPGGGQLGGTAGGGGSIGGGSGGN